MKEFKLPKLEGEYWWGGYVDLGEAMPVSPQSRLEISFRKNMSLNQANPVCMSSAGRYIWSDSYFDVKFDNGQVEVFYDDGVEKPVVGQCANLREAYLEVTKKYYPYEGKVPPAEFFTLPQYNTWISLMYWQSQEKILSYAESIRENGGTGKILFIDCGWQKDYGEWEFNERFPNPESMTDRLHELGFKVILWVVPFVSPDSLAYRELKEEGLLITNPDGKPFLSEWWDGYSAVIDLSSPKGKKWLNDKLCGLREKYGIDGFKFDAGDPRFYADDNRTYANVTPNGESEIWADFAAGYEYNELRACCKNGGRALVQRIADRHHVWNDNHGLAGLVAKCVAQSISGYAFLCPDMVGGGLFSDFLNKSADELEKELFIRYCQAAALMPMMQFSFDYWRVFDRETVDICNRYAKLHEEFGDYILKCAEETAKGGLPIIRNMAMQFNDLYDVRDQFMLGDDYLVAPVVKRGITKQSVKLPRGRWKYIPSGEEFDGGKTIEVDAPIDVLPYFRCIKI